MLSLLNVDSQIHSNWTWPKIEGILDFKGHLTHSASWKHDFDYTGTDIAIIGNGSSGIQILPTLYPKVNHLTTFIRTPTYITAAPLGSHVIGATTNVPFTVEQQEAFKSHPSTMLELRKKIQTEFNRGFKAMIRGSEAHLQSEKFNRNSMLEKLSKNSVLKEKLMPDYNYGCRRSTPGEGYLEALLDETKTTVINSPIMKITADSVICEDGSETKVNAIVCATGFDVSCRPRWPHIGLESRNLADEWKTKPRAYLSLCANGYPNYFTALGPNSPVGHGSLMAVIDWTIDYILRWTKKIAEEDIKSVEVTKEAVDDWNVYAQEFLKRTTWAGECRSWYKNHQAGDEITALYPGSILHYYEMTEKLRPEDFNIKYRSKNRFKFTGSGFTELEQKEDGDLAWYLERSREVL
jgi:cation diffusion facilitator CzcD-associated flavoprotein CzcO